MAIVTIINDVLGEPTEKEIDDLFFIDFLQREFPDGFNQPVEVLLNDVILSVDDFDVSIHSDDYITMIFKPADPVSILASIAISMAVSYIANQFVDEPSMPSLNANNPRALKNPQSVYALSGQNNQFSVGQVIPTIYGTVKTTPSLITPPYRVYDNNEEYLFQLFCLGNGIFTIDDILVSDTSINDLDGDSLQTTIITQADLVGTNISDYISDTLYRELVTTSGSVSNLEVRGTPQTTSKRTYFNSNYVIFGTDISGEHPDISSLQPSSLVTFSGASNPSNNGTFTVSSTDLGLNKVVFSDATFTEEPVQTTVVFPTSSYYGISGYTLYNNSFSSQQTINITVGKIYNVTIGGVVYNDLKVTRYSWVDTGTSWNLTINFDRNVFPNQFYYSDTDIVIYESMKDIDSSFETTYGRYTLTDTLEKTQAVASQKCEFDIEFPRGLYNSVSGAFQNRTVDFKVFIDYWGGSTWTNVQEVNLSATNNDNSPIRETFTINIGTMATNISKLGFRIKRVTAEPSDTTSQDKLILRRAKAYFNKTYGNQDFGNVTLLWTKMKATNAINSQGQNQVSVLLSRSDVNNTVKDVITDIVTNTDYGAGLSPTILNLPTTTELVNGAFENEMNTAEALRVAGNAGRYQVKQDGNEITISKDSEQTLPVFMFNETNMLKDSLTTSYSFGKERDIDGYRVLYRDPTTFQEKEALYPATSDRPEVVELWGCTDYDVAFSEANYIWRKYLNKRNTIEFKTDYQGYIPQYMDKIEVAHNLFKNSQASEIVSESITVSGTRSINLADDVQGTPNQVIVIDELGKPQSYPITSINGNNITVTMSDSVVLYTDFTRDRSKVSLGTSSSMSKEYTIQSIKPSQDNTMTISAINYDERVYDWTQGWAINGALNSITLEPYYQIIFNATTTATLSKTIKLYGNHNIDGYFVLGGDLKIYEDETKANLLKTVLAGNNINYTNTSLSSVYIEIYDDGGVLGALLRDLEIN